MQVVSETEGALPALPMHDGVAMIDGPAGVLEVRIDVAAAGDRGFDCVVCHPHPLYGGTLDNKVVHTLARAVRDAGGRALRFNFRGVGRSAGRHDDGRGEVDDLRAVLAVQAASGRPLLLAGFSFGAFVAASLAASVANLPATGGHRPQAVLLVAPPVHYPGFAVLPPFALPVTVFMGRDDDVVDPGAVADWCAARQLPLTAFAAGHFFHGALPELKAATGEWVRTACLSAGAGAG